MRGAFWRIGSAWLLIGIGFAGTQAWSDVRQDLSSRLGELHFLAADFTQRLEDAQGRVIEESSGRVRLLPPNFRWEVTEPHVQVLVATEDELRVYDPDLEQVTIRPLADVLEDTPLALLTQGTAVLGDNYDVARLDGERFSVRPRAPDALFDELVLTFGEAGLVGLGINDHLGQRTIIRFHRFQDASVIQSADFQLNLPPGTDVY